MTDWRQVTGDIVPALIDRTSSPTTVYERKDVQPVTRTDIDGTERTQYTYLERTFTQAEYDIIEGVTEKVQLRHETDIIDEYTMELVSEGVI